MEGNKMPQLAPETLLNNECRTQLHFSTSKLARTDWERCFDSNLKYPTRITMDQGKKVWAPDLIEGMAIQSYMMCFM